MNNSPHLLIETGSSETLRKTTLDFKINQDFLQWFCGFSEGDGSFIVSQGRLFFIINQKEEKILHQIRTNLGFGKVSRYGHYSRFIVANRKSIDQLISLFNGNLRLHKTHQRFLLWCHARNAYSADRVELIERDKLDGGGWLAGFIDAEGCFNVEKQARRLGGQLRTPALRFILDQKGEWDILQEIKTFLGSGYINRRSECHDMWRYVTSNERSHEKLALYLQRHPLRTLKKVQFLRWRALSRYCQRRKLIPWQGKVEKRVDNLMWKIKSSH